MPAPTLMKTVNIIRGLWVRAQASVPPSSGPLQGVASRVARKPLSSASTRGLVMLRENFPAKAGVFSVKTPSMERASMNTMEVIATRKARRWKSQPQLYPQKAARAARMAKLARIPAENRTPIRARPFRLSPECLIRAMILRLTTGGRRA
jgi:hypothetical protein